MCMGLYLMYLLLKNNCKETISVRATVQYFVNIFRNVHVRLHNLMLHNDASLFINITGIAQVKCS